VDFSISLQDDDQIFSATVPAGTLQPLSGGGWQLVDGSGTVGGLRRLRIRRAGAGLAREPEPGRRA
jgi:hypothetical protein